MTKKELDKKINEIQVKMEDMHQTLRELRESVGDIISDLEEINTDEEPKEGE